MIVDGDRTEFQDLPGEKTIDPQMLIVSLRSKGADRVDPVRFRYLEALAARTLPHQGKVRRILDEKLAQALSAFTKRIEQTHSKVVSQDDTGRCRPLADLVCRLMQQTPESLDEEQVETVGPPLELKAISHFRNTWSRLSVNKQLTQAINQGPENAGPLNSHFLVLRSLELMREISPDYLNRFMSHVDTLLCLDQADKKNKPAAKKPLKAKTTRK